MNVLSNLKISKKISLIVFIAIAFLVGMAGINLYQLGKVFELANYATVNTVPSFNALYETEIQFYKLRLLLRDHVLNTDATKMAAIERGIAETRDEIASKQKYYEDKLISEPEDLRLLRATKAAFIDYTKVVLDPALGFSQQNKNVEAREIVEKNHNYVSKVEQTFVDHLDYNNKLAISGSKEAADSKTMAFWINGIVTIMVLLLIVIISWVVSKIGLVNPIRTVVENLKQLAEGQVNVSVSGVERGDEIGDIARSAQVFNEFVQKLNTQSWIKTHTSEIAAALQQAEDFRTLTQSAVSKLAPVIGAGHGAFYVVDAEGRYNLLATYGYRERKHLSNSYSVGEGLIGQCVMEKETIMLTAPKDYIRISSGLGEGPPACIMVLPIIHDKRVLGVLEMASFQQFSDREKAVLEAVVPVLAISMEILDRNMRTKELLASTQEQSERMEKQAAQLEEQTVEMEAQQSELLETENWFRSIIETAPDGMMVVDNAGNLLLTNPKAEKLFGYDAGELASGNIKQLLPDQDFSGDKGATQDGVQGKCKDGGTISLMVSSSPLPARGHRGRCVSVSVREC